MPNIKVRIKQHPVGSCGDPNCLGRFDLKLIGKVFNNIEEQTHYNWQNSRGDAIIIHGFLVNNKKTNNLNRDFFAYSNNLPNSYFVTRCMFDFMDNEIVKVDLVIPRKMRKVGVDKVKKI